MSRCFAAIIHRWESPLSQLTILDRYVAAHWEGCVCVPACNDLLIAEPWGTPPGLVWYRPGAFNSFLKTSLAFCLPHDPHPFWGPSPIITRHDPPYKSDESSSPHNQRHHHHYFYHHHQLPLSTPRKYHEAKRQTHASTSSPHTQQSRLLINWAQRRNGFENQISVMCLSPCYMWPFIPDFAISKALPPSE